MSAAVVRLVAESTNQAMGGGNKTSGNVCGGVGRRCQAKCEGWGTGRQAMGGGEETGCQATCVGGEHDIRQRETRHVNGGGAESHHDS